MPDDNFDNDKDYDDVPTITIKIEGPLTQAQKMIVRTEVGKDQHQACVCVICNHFIRPPEQVCYLTKNMSSTSTEL